MYPAYFKPTVPATPASVPKTPLPSSTCGARAKGNGLHAAEVGCATTFVVESLDAYGERRRGGGDVVVARLMVGGDVTVEAATVDNTDGSFNVTYVAESVDRRQKLYVSVNGIPVKGSPFRPKLSPGPVSAKSSTVSGTQLYDSVAGRPTTIHVQARDCFGNPRRTGGDAFAMNVKAGVPNRIEYKETFRTWSQHYTSTDNGDGTYSITWSADLPGSYDLEVSLDRTPIKGSPFRCYLASEFVRPPLSLAAVAVEATEKSARAPKGRGLAKSRETAVPLSSDRPACAMVDGQLVVLSSALSTEKATHRWPSVHACQFEAQYSNEDAYMTQNPPPCRWRSCLLPSHQTEAKHTLVGGISSVYVLSQSGGDKAPIDNIACAEVVGGGSWRPPQSFVALRCAGRVPEAQSAFCAVYLPPVLGVRRPKEASPEPDPPPKSADDDDDEEPTPPPKKAPPKEEAEEGGETMMPIDFGPCIWLLGGVRSDLMGATLDIYDVDNERWLGDPLAFEDGPKAPTAANAAACVVPSAEGNQLIYMFGGKAKDVVINEMWEMDVRRLAWRPVEASGDIPAPRCLHTMTRLLTRYLVLFGGVDSDMAPVLDFSIFDLGTSCWSQHRPYPVVPRIGHAAGSAAGCLYIFGGSDGHKPNSQVLRFDCHQLFPQLSALKFDGAPEKAMVCRASPTLSALTDKFTVECWVAPNSFVNNGPAVVKADSAYRTGFGLIAIDEATAKKFVALEKEKVKDGGAKERNPWESSLADAEMLPTMCFFVDGMKRETAALARVHPGEWSHVAATYDGKTLVTYVNGRRADYISPDPPIEVVNHPKEGDLWVGGIGGKYAFDGLIDAVRVWSVALSWEDIRDRMNDTLHGSEHPTLIGQWSCNEGAGELCVDSSSKQNHATLEGDVARIMCTRDHVAPHKTISEVHVEQSFDKLRKWRIDFEKRAGREVTAADLLLADDEIRKTARRLGLLG